MGDSSFQEIRHLPVPDEVQLNRSKPIFGTTRWGDYAVLMHVDGRSQEFWQGKSILDVGSGEKMESPDRAFPGAKVFAIDPEFGKGGEVQSNSAHECRPGIVQNIPYPDESFDLVLCSRVLTHIFPIDLEKSIRELVRVAKPDGEVRLHYALPQVMEEVRTLEQE